MSPSYTFIRDLAREVQPPNKGIMSRTLFNDDRLKAVLFSFAQGEELSEHTARCPPSCTPSGRGHRDAWRRPARGDDRHLGPHADRPAP